MKRAITLLVALVLPYRRLPRTMVRYLGLQPRRTPKASGASIREYLAEATLGSQASIRELVGNGFTPHLTLSFTLPTVIGDTRLPPTRIQPGDDFDSTLAWRFQHMATKVGTGIESTAFAGLVVPGPQSAFNGVSTTTNAPGFMVGAVTGRASLSHYVWLGSTFTKLPITTAIGDPTFWTTAWCMDVGRRSGDGHRTNGTGGYLANWWVSVRTGSHSATLL